MIEYCSRLAKTGQYQYNKNKEQNFAANSCRCLDQDKNVYLGIGVYYYSIKDINRTIII